MRLSLVLRTSACVTALCLCVQGQNTPTKDAQINEEKGLPARATPADYEAHAQAGTFSTEDYVAVETGLFGSPGERIKLSIEDFSLRINGKKTPLSSQPYALIFGSLKDPEWAPPDAPEAKSKTSIGGGGGGNEPPPPPPKMPMELRRAMEQHVQNVVLREGDRALPQAGLIFFEYRGKTQKIHSLELTYTGPAGKATLALQP